MKKQNMKIIVSIAFLFSMTNVIAMIQFSNASAVGTFTDVPLGACIEYSVEFTELSTGDQISISEKFHCKPVAVNDSGVVVTERWDIPTLAKNDSLYSHYYISKEDIITLKATFSEENITFGGVEFTVINITSGTTMTDIAQYDWYIYDTKTGLGLAAYKADSGNDLITESWLTSYSVTCEGGENDVPGYDTLGIIMVMISTVALVLVKKSRKIKF